MEPFGFPMWGPSAACGLPTLYPAAPLPDQHDRHPGDVDIGPAPVGGEYRETESARGGQARPITQSEAEVPCPRRVGAPEQRRLAVEGNDFDPLRFTRGRHRDPPWGTPCCRMPDAAFVDTMGTAAPTSPASLRWSTRDHRRGSQPRRRRHRSDSERDCHRRKRPANQGRTRKGSA